MAPRYPQTRKNKKAHKVEIELPLPSHCCHISEEYREQIPAMFRYSDDRIHGDCDENSCKDKSHFVHSKFTFLELRGVKLPGLPNS